MRGSARAPPVADGARPSTRPVVIAAGLGPSFDLLVDYPFTDFRDYQSLPFPLAYDGPAEHVGLARRLPGALGRAAAAALPPARAGRRAGRGAGRARAVALRVTHRPAAVFALGCLAYLLVRTDLFHTAPLAVLLARARPDTSRGRPGARSASLLASRWCTSPSRAPTVAGSSCARTSAPSSCRSPTACACRRGRPPSSRRRRRRRLAAGEPIYVTARRGDLVTAGHPLLYVLAGRPEPHPLRHRRPRRRHERSGAAGDRARPRAPPGPGSSCAGWIRARRLPSPTEPGG